MARVRVYRSQQLVKKLTALKERTSEPVRIAMEVAAEKICAMMRRLAPVDGGDLRNSIGWTWGDAPRGSISQSHSKGDMRLTIYAGNEKAFYARWVEFGTAPHATGKGSDVSAKRKRKQYGSVHPGASPNPFFYPAYRALKKDTVRAINKSIRLAVRKELQ